MTSKVICTHDVLITFVFCDITLYILIMIKILFGCEIYETMYSDFFEFHINIKYLFNILIFSAEISSLYFPYNQ